MTLSLICQRKPLALVLLCALAACGTPQPFADSPAGAEQATPPKLIPIGSILAAADAPRRSAEVPAQLDTRATALQSRADALRAK